MFTGELFECYEENPILKRTDWPYPVASVMNPGATKLNGKTILLVRAEDRRGYSHLSIASSSNGVNNWKVNKKPVLTSNEKLGEAIFGLEDARIVWFEERKEYIITCVCFFAGVSGNPPGIVLKSTKDFIDFKDLGQQLLPVNKDACLFPRKFKGRYALIHRPFVDGTADIWVSFSPDLRHWGDNRVMLSTRPRSWDEYRVGLGPPPVETEEGWVIIYHGARYTASGPVYRIGLALLDLETLELKKRCKEWVFGPEEESNIVFPCGAVRDGDDLYLYYGIDDSDVGMADTKISRILKYLEKG